MRHILAAIAFISPSFVHAQPAKSLKLVWEHATPNEFPQGMVVDALKRPYLHVAMKNGGLLILDTSNGAKPKVAAKLDLDHFAKLHVMHLTQHGDHLYLALGDFFDANGAPAGLAVVDIKNPAAPKVVSLWQSPQKLHGSAIVVVEGKYAYLGAMTEGVMIFDVSRPDKIAHLATFQPDVDFPRKKPNKVQHPNARGLFLHGKLLYVAYDAGGLRIVDVADKRKPKEIGRYINKGMLHKQQAYNNVVLDRNLLYIAVDYAGLEIVDVSDPRDIRPVGWWNPWDAHLLKSIWFNSDGHTNQMVLDAKKKLAYLSAGDSELQVVDVSKPAQPRLAAKFGEVKDKRAVWGLAMSSDRVYLTYMTALIPFHATWAGVKAVER
jgi:hypothetical protein